MIITIIFILLFIITLLIYYLFYKCKKIVKWIFVMELTPNSTVECRVCNLIKTYPDGRIKVRVIKDNSIQYAKLIGSNYYFLDQCDKISEYIDSIKFEKLEELKNHDIQRTERVES